MVFIKTWIATNHVVSYRCIHIKVTCPTQAREPTAISKHRLRFVSYSANCFILERYNGCPLNTDKGLQLRSLSTPLFTGLWQNTGHVQPVKGCHVGKTNAEFTETRQALTAVSANSTILWVLSRRVFLVIDDLFNDAFASSDCRLQMICRDVQEDCLACFKALSRKFPGTEENQKLQRTPVWIMGAPAENRTGYLSNTYYRSGNARCNLVGCS
jgi:hypothetical protein